jgi:FixJ family two-component response regulator
MPIVFITAHADETVRPRVLAQGAVACLGKPCSETALLGGCPRKKHLDSLAYSCQGRAGRR